ncbi:MAG: glycosyltransferase family 2 protein [Christensenellaceae bacterium]|jgi:glycosyltransferase involved in cell wall biosynthesis
MKDERIDILLATYNGELHIREQLDSLLLQTHENIRILARDDGSGDKTPAILEAYAKRHPDRLTVVQDSVKSNGAKQNFFALTKHATAGYIMFCDQDDVWEPSKAGQSYHAMKQAEERQGPHIPVLVHADLAVVDERLVPVSASMMHMQKLNPRYNTPNRLLAQNNVTGCTVMINRALADLWTKDDPRIIMHDWWLALIAAEFGKIIYIDQPLVKYRQHTGNEVGAKDVRSVSYYRSKMGNTRSIHQSIVDTYQQGEAFLDCFGEKIENKVLYEAFASMGNCNIFGRFFRLSKYKFYKNGLYRKIGQIIYG